MNDKRWVEDRLAKLEPARDWRPNAAEALLRLHAKKRGARSRRKTLVWVTAMAAVVFIGAMMMPVSGACAPPPVGCVQHRLWETVFHAAPAVEPIATPSPPVAIVPAPLPAPVAARPKPRPPLAVRNFKELGSAKAPVVCEVYTDYQCPHCATLFRETIPLLIAEYVDTGKVRLVHRDFPLQAFAYSKLAARYANAAGQLGHYQAVVDQIFGTQAAWGASGDVDAPVAQVLPPDVMRKVRDLVEHDAKLDDSVAADQAMARQDQIHQTPSVVVVSKGKRKLLPGSPSYNMLKSYLDELLRN